MTQTQQLPFLKLTRAQWDILNECACLSRRYNGKAERPILRLRELGLVEFDMEPMANCGRPLNIYVVKTTELGRRVAATGRLINGRIDYRVPCHD